MDNWPTPTLSLYKDIGKDNFHELIRLFKSNKKNKTTIIKNFIIRLELKLNTIPCYGTHCNWAYSYGKNAGGHYTNDCSIGYYYLARFDDQDTKILLNEHHVHATEVYTLAEIANIFNICL